LLCAIRAVNNLNYGYLTGQMLDTGIHTATLTLCGFGKRKYTKNHQITTEAAIKAWAIGRGFGTVRVTWVKDGQLTESALYEAFKKRD
jgi:hypothetical protein